MAQMSEFLTYGPITYHQYHRQDQIKDKVKIRLKHKVKNGSISEFILTHRAVIYFERPISVSELNYLSSGTPCISHGHPCIHINLNMSR